MRTTFKAARDARQKNDLRAALQGYREVIALTEGATDLELLQARMASGSEVGLLLQQLSDLRGAVASLEDAVAVSDRVVALRDEPAVRLSVAGVRVNLASALVAGRHLQQALAVLDEVQPTLDAAGSEAQVELLRTIVDVQRGSSLVMTGREEEGLAALRGAVERGATQADNAHPAALPQAVDALGRYAGALRSLGRGAEAVDLAERLARQTEAAFEEAGAPMAQLFVAARMQWVNTLVDAGAYASAEDELWRAIEASGDSNVLIRGADFYADLWRKSDEQLTAGGLPRREVAESWEDLINQVEERGADAGAVQLMRARHGLWVVDAASAARAALEALNGAESQPTQLARSLAGGLRREIALVEAQSAGKSTPGG